MTYLQRLEKIIDEVIEPSAVAIDREGIFPRAAISAMGEAGLLGLMSDVEVGGMGLGTVEAAEVVERIGRICSSTALVLTMHYSGIEAVEKHAEESVRRDIVAGRHLLTLAWSEVGSRSHFWVPLGTARRDGDEFVLDGEKSMVTSALEADYYVWSSKPAQASGASTLWLVGSRMAGLSQPKQYDGVGLRGNCSAPVSCRSLRIPESSMLGPDGGGFDIMIWGVLPVYCVLLASSMVGVMDAAIAHACKHVAKGKFVHTGGTISELPTIRAYLAKARVKADMARSLRDEALLALSTEREDAMLRVMEAKAATAEAALEVTDVAMRVCGGAAFRKDSAIERYFRDARAASIMAPTSDVLFDFIGRAICDMPIFT
ncbi:MAG: acyl-CoA/acyl-ACP dehydrogenase [Burkholderiales bacterium]|nr:acyl-CoA/acyl-ACP dehydrogenase [Burkholderiales bacterium]